MIDNLIKVAVAADKLDLAISEYDKYMKYSKRVAGELRFVFLNLNFEIAISI